MGPWPKLLERPKIDFEEKQDRDGGVVQQRVQLEIESGGAHV